MHLARAYTSTYVHQFISTAILTSIFVDELVDQKRPAVADNVRTVSGSRILPIFACRIFGFLEDVMHAG